MKKLVTLIITLVVLTIMLCSCSQTTSGTITDKKHVNSYTSLLPIRCGNITTLTPVFHPETWVIVVKDAKGEKHNVDVSQAEFNNLNIGDEWEGGGNETD